MRKIIFYSLILFGLFISAQDGDEKEENQLDNYYIDFAVPDLAANTLLGIENDQVARPGNLKEFAVALSSLSGTDGKLNPSLAVEYAPLLSLSKSTNENYWKRGFRWSNLALSFASQVDDSLGNRAGLGFKWVPFDYSDPIGDDAFKAKIGDFLREKNDQTDSEFRQAFQDSILSVISDTLNVAEKVTVSSLLEISNKSYRDKLIERHQKGDIGSLSKHLKDSLRTLTFYDKLTENQKDRLDGSAEKFAQYTLDKESFEGLIEKKIAELKKEYKEQNWNAFVIQLSGGFVWNSDSATIQDLTNEKTALFLGVSLPLSFSEWFKKHGQFIFNASYTNNTSDLVDLDNRTSIGGRVLIGNSDKRLSLEGQYVNALFTSMDENGDQIRDESFRWSFGGEIKLSQGNWLELAIGGQKLINGDTRILPSFGLKHALQNERRFNTK